LYSQLGYSQFYGQLGYSQFCQADYKTGYNQADYTKLAIAKLTIQSWL
jgi:hypothetical protein